MNGRHATIFRRLSTALLTLVAATVCASAAPPEAPENLTVSISYDSSYQADLSWEASAGNGIRYRVYVRNASSGDSAFTLFATTNDTEYSFTEDDLDICCTIYSYMVTAIKGNEESDESNVVSTVYGRDYNEGDFGLTSGFTSFLSTPTTGVLAGEEYRYDADVAGELAANDPREVRYSLLKGPEGMTIDPTSGLVTWTAKENGMYNVTIAATIVGGTESGRQTWTLSVNSASSVDDESGTVTTSVYPNPSTSLVTFRLATLTAATSLRVTGIDGATVHTATASAGETSVTLDVRSYEPGLYFLSVENESEKRTIPFHVVR